MIEIVALVVALVALFALVFLMGTQYARAKITREYERRINLINRWAPRG